MMKMIQKWEIIHVITSDFTNEFATLVSTTNLNEKITNFILDHKEDFYDKYIPEKNEENGVDEDEGTSN